MDKGVPHALRENCRSLKRRQAFFCLMYVKSDSIKSYKLRNNTISKKKTMGDV